MQDWEYGRLTMWFDDDHATIQVHLPHAAMKEERTGAFLASDYIQGVLNHLGGEGWELVAIENPHGTTSNYWLKRRAD